jgi:hypothetical protein
VESRLGDGTTITISLPVAGREVEENPGEVTDVESGQGTVAH